MNLKAHENTVVSVDIAVIGWGKGGKTLAAGLGKAGKKVAVIERSPMMMGGTCINIGCVPTKALVHQSDVARTLRASGVLNAEDVSAKDTQFAKAVKARDGLIDKVRAVNHQMLAEVDSVTLISGNARLAGREGDLTQIDVELNDGGTVRVSAPAVVLNTGSVPVIPEAIEEIDEEIRNGGADIALPEYAETATTERGIFTSTTIQHASPRPERLVIVGAGFIALEFASMFAGFGSQVTVVNRSPQILGHEDDAVRESVTEVLTGAGITFEHGATTLAVTGSRKEGDLAVKVRVGSEEKTIPADGVLLATGRRPATDGLGLENVGIERGRRGEVPVDDFCRTTVPGIFAVGDVNGGPQHTYISLDDFRIVKDQLVGKGERKLSDRVAVPATTFLTPPLSQVGLTAKEAQEQGYEVRVATKPVAAIKAMPRPKTLGDARGVIHFVVDAASDLILGARLFHVDSQEVINLVALAMRAGVTASELRDGIWTHPSSTEALNEVLAEL